MVGFRLHNTRRYRSVFKQRDGYAKKQRNMNVALPTSRANAPRLRFFPRRNGLPSSPFLWTVSEMRLLPPEMQALPLHVFAPPPPKKKHQQQPPARASGNNSRWTRLSVMETARCSSPLPLHFYLRKNWYSRKRTGALSVSSYPPFSAFKSLICGCHFARVSYSFFLLRAA